MKISALIPDVPELPPLKMAAVPPPDMRPVRSGLQVVTTPGMKASPHAPQIISHRRSGTHLLATIIERHWSLSGWLKSHDFPERRSLGRKSIYVVRNPIDCLHSTWLWWRTGGGAHNARIAEVMDQLTFEQWLNGDAGKICGYTAWRDGERDNLEINRGQFYDPIRYWVDHVLAAVSVGLPIIRYDQLTSWPEGTTDILVNALERSPVTAPGPVTERVGLMPAEQIPTNAQAMEAWPVKHVARLRELLTDELLTACGLVNSEAWLVIP